MQNYTTIIGVIELRAQKCSYDTVQKLYSAWHLLRIPLPNRKLNVA